MNILIIPDPTAPNGEDALCREVSRRSLPRGHRTSVQAVPNGPLAAVIEELSAASFASKADLVLLNSLQPAPLLAARQAGKKLAIRLIDAYTGASAQALAEISGLAFQADLLIIPSRFLEDQVLSWPRNGAHGPPKIAVIPYAYDKIRAQQITVVTMRASRPSGFPLVTAGVLNEATRPGMETLLASLTRLRMDCHLTVIGEGPALPALRARAERLVVSDKVTFAGGMPHDKIMEFLRASKAYVDPCGLDGFPMLALHAMSEGCPVVAVRAGALPELVNDGENGLLFPMGEAMALSEAVVTLSSVRGMSLKLIAGGIATVERHSWEATVASILTALESVVGASHTNGTPAPRP